MNTPPQEPPLTVLLGLPFHDLTLAETLDYCTTAMQDDHPRFLVTANVDFTTQAYQDPDLRKIVFFADRVVCDGMPLVWLSRWFGYPLRERVTGSDMVPQLLAICAAQGHSVYFFGSDLATLVEAKAIVETRYPGLKVAGLDSPPHGAVIEWDNEALCAKMRASGARLLLVCLGCPKQERWIWAHHRESGIPLSIGVGASLDFITGKQKRAPRWMQKTGMEWFWRMSGSPTRLVSRYSKDLAFLLQAAWQQALSQRRRRILGGSVQQQSPQELPQEPPLLRIAWRGDLQKRGLTDAPLPETIAAPVVLDASGVTFMDSAGLGQLALLIRLCRGAQQPLVVVQPAAAFTMAVRAVRMDSLFPMLATEAAASDWLRQHHASGGIHKQTVDGVAWVSFNRPLDALYHDEMMAILEAAIANNPQPLRKLVVDLREVTFIDSRAVGGLIRLWKTLTAMGGQLFLAGANPTLREIIRLLHLDKIIPEWKGDFPI
jgi:N-acetylglucosaminyldiphosphoundecaprenol N-acetyl-beta-D-mannosaminyltransferase